MQAVADKRADNRQRRERDTRQARHDWQHKQNARIYEKNSFVVEKLLNNVVAEIAFRRGASNDNTGCSGN